MTDGTVTGLLIALQEGQPGALDALIPVVYEHLRAMAASHLQGDRGTPTLQPTALVHELYFKLVDQRSATWQNRAHFFATTAILMRRLIVDHARRYASEKRGGNNLVPLDEGLDQAVTRPEEILQVHEALETLAGLDARQARLVELRFFGGLTNEDAAEVLGVSLATAKRDWALARAWLHAELGT
jgi:RNA polymerase sigma factor (TIGR02999 family)